MNKFVSKILSFSILISCVALICLIAPQTPRMLHSPIYGKIKKDSLLNHVIGPRIVFIGGSNLPFGLDSKMIKDSLGLNPVNTGIMHTVGLKIMLDNYLKYSKSNDLVIISPEYSHFFGNFMNGEASTLYFASVNHMNPLQGLDYGQLKSVLPHLPKYIFRKLDPREYWGFSISKFFNSQSFNEYGDIHEHWTLEPKPFSSEKEPDDEFNQEVIDYILHFQEVISNKNAKLYISPAPFNESSAKNNTKQIQLVERKLKEAGLKTIGEFEEYIFDDSLFFNSPYHLIKSGTELRTKMFISDFKARTHNNVSKK